MGELLSDLADENDADDRYYVLYQGMAARTFERSFQLADYVQVKARAWGPGSHTSTSCEIPEAIKSRAIVIARSSKRLEVKPTWGGPNCENTIEAFSMKGYGLRVPIISAQARATAASGDGAPGIVAHPPFSTNVPRSQA